MGRIKNYLILAFLIIASVGCEKESIDLPEENVNSSRDLTFAEFLNSGIDVDNYIKTISDRERNAGSFSYNRSHSNFSNAQEEYFKEFCDNLPVEDFEEARIDSGTGSEFKGPLSENNSNTTRIQPSDIESGLLITTDNVSPILAIFGDGYRDGHTKVIVGKTDQALVLQFSEDVVSVGLDISSFPYPGMDNTQEVTVEVQYVSGETVEETFTTTMEGTFWGITGGETIQQLTISSTNNDAWVGVDNIAFGTCLIPDSDFDGCPDSNDSNNSSNLEATVNIGGCDSGVANRMTSACGISLSDEVDRFERGDYRNNGALVKEFASLTNLWVSEGLISSEEKGLMMSCAAKAGLQ